MNSIQTWEYENSSNYNGSSKDPTQGSPHVFWDEAHAFIAGAGVAPGSTITLQMDAANTASYYNIDVVDIEAPPAPLTQSANSLSLTTDCGAVATTPSFDSTTAIQSCFNKAQSQGKSVWIPQGTFYVNTATGGLTATGITIQGAGMWYSVIYFNPPLPLSTRGHILLPVSSTLMDLAIDANAISQTVGGGYSYGINIKGSNWLINRVWIRHAGPSVWADGNNGIVENCRINNSWADGINLNNGSGAAGNNSGNNLTAMNNFIRGTGDDGLAINDSTDAPEMTNTTIVNNTMVAPWWADNIGVYGGQGDLVANNLLTDSVKLRGINIGPFTVAGGPIVSASIQGNIVNRGGSLGYGFEHAAIGVGTTGPVTANAGIIIRGNTVNNSLFDGMDVQFAAIPTTIANNTVGAPGFGSTSSHAFSIISGAQGGAAFTCNTVTNLAAGQQAYVDMVSASNFAATGSCNNGFTVGGSAEVVAIAAGGPAQSNAGGGDHSFVADEDFSGGGLNSPVTGTINLTQPGANAAPMGVYQNGRAGIFTYTIPGLTAGSTYTVLLHFAETYFGATGDRQFNVAINGTPVITNLDIYANVGKDAALVENFNTTANSSGQVVIAFTNGAADQPVVMGIEVRTN